MKYIVANLKNSLSDNNVNDYINNLGEFDNLIVCPSKKYLDLFKDDFNIGMQDYFNLNYKYVILNHYEKNDTKDVVKEKIVKSINDNKTIILCVGSNDLNDISSTLKELDEYLININYDDILIAYEPYSLIGQDEKVNIKKIKTIVKEIKIHTKNKYKVLYGGNVNESNIKKILKVSDGVLIGRLSFDSQKLTKIMSKLIKVL